MAVFGDVHLGHRQNTASEIIANLDREFPDTAATAALDIIFIEGDLFDRLITITSPDVIAIQAWLVRFLRLCVKHDILLRILEGTRSHDWGQFPTHAPLNDLANIGADIQYVSELSIEYIDKLGISVLYVPDDLGPTETTEENVKALLRARGLQQVDYAIMHGQFEHQLPPHVKAPMHRAAFYLSIVKELIFIGHVHQFSQYLRIIASGSFDRLGHGDELPKGHTRHTRFPNGEYETTFIENVHAKKFVTVDCVGTDIQTAMERLKDRASKLPKYSHIRILAEPNHPVLESLDELYRTFPFIRWVVKKFVEGEKEDATVIVDEDAEMEYVPVQLTRDNIRPLMLERLASRAIPAAVFETACRLLEEVA